LRRGGVRGALVPAVGRGLFRQAALSFEFLRMAALFLAGAGLIGRSSAETDPGVQRRSWIALLVGVLCAGFVMVRARLRVGSSPESQPAAVTVAG